MMLWSGSDFPILDPNTPGGRGMGGGPAALPHSAGHGQGCTMPALSPTPCPAPLLPLGLSSPGKAWEGVPGAAWGWQSICRCLSPPPFLLTSFSCPLSLCLPCPSPLPAKGFAPPGAAPPSRSKPRGSLCEGNEVPLLSLPAGSVQEAAGTLAGGSRRHGSPAGWEEWGAAAEPPKHDPTPSTVYEAGTQVRP